MRFLFGESRGNISHFTVEAKSLDDAIRLFKVEVLFPESYVAEDFIESREYTHDDSEGEIIDNHVYKFKANPLIYIYVSMAAGITNDQHMTSGKIHIPQSVCQWPLESPTTNTASHWKRSWG